ncbi:unnamed protein product, partial [Ectocarpus sp. 12 AP-2014]
SGNGIGGGTIRRRTLVGGGSHQAAGAVQPEVSAGGLPGAHQGAREAGGGGGGGAPPHAQRHPGPDGKRAGVRPRQAFPQIGRRAGGRSGRGRGSLRRRR